MGAEKEIFYEDSGLLFDIRSLIIVDGLGLILGLSMFFLSYLLPSLIIGFPIELNPEKFLYADNSLEVLLMIFFYVSEIPTVIFLFLTLVYIYAMIKSKIGVWKSDRNLTFWKNIKRSPIYFVFFGFQTLIIGIIITIVLPF
jgi:hypothetical protein